MVTGILVTSGHQHAVEWGSHPESIIAEVQIYSTGSWQFPSKVSTLSTVVHKDRPVLWISLRKKKRKFTFPGPLNVLRVCIPTFPPFFPTQCWSGKQVPYITYIVSGIVI